MAVYTGRLEGPWSRACHLAGANCVLSKESDEKELAAGLRRGIRGGCFTDPRFAA
jgi:DNA-binding NarL/FixJ family response regulator